MNGNIKHTNYSSGVRVCAFWLLQRRVFTCVLSGDPWVTVGHTHLGEILVKHIYTTKGPFLPFPLERLERLERGSVMCVLYHWHRHLEAWTIEAAHNPSWRASKRVFTGSQRHCAGTAISIGAAGG